VTISHDKNDAFVSIIDMMGKVWLNQRISDNSESLDISHLATGVYWVKIQKNRVIETKKIIKVE